MCKIMFHCIITLLLVLFSMFESALFDNITEGNLDPYFKCPGIEEESFCIFPIESPFPYDCPYQKPIDYPDFQLSESSFDKFWINAKRNAMYGYYEYLGIGSKYKHLLVEEVAVSENLADCVVATSEETFLTENCDDDNTGLCVYPINEPHTYCRAFDEICNASGSCLCKTGTSNFFCEYACEAIGELECGENCWWTFQREKRPSIELRYKRGKTFTVIVSRALKLAYLNNGLRMYCFTDALKPSEDALYAEITKHVVSEYVSDNRQVYEIELQDPKLAHYWCEGFEYPTLNKVVSNTIVAGIEIEYQYFALTLKLDLSLYTFLPYNVHTQSTETIGLILGNESTPRFVEVFPIYNRGENIDVRLRFIRQNDDPLCEFEIVENILDQLTVNESIVEYSLRNCKFCTAHNTTHDDVVLHWSTVNLGEVITSEELFVLEDGLPLRRICTGNFSYGAFWAILDDSLEAGVPSRITEDLYLLMTSEKPAEELNQDLSQLLHDVADVIPYDVLMMGKILEKIADSEEPFNRRTFTESVDTITTIDRYKLAIAQRELNATDIILYSLDLALGRIDEEYDTQITTGRVVAQIVDLKATDVRGMAIYENGRDFYIQPIRNGTTPFNLDTKNLRLAMYLPPVLIQQIFSSTDSERLNLVTSVFTNDVLFNEDGNTTTKSFIISIYVTNFHGTVLLQSIPVIFKSGGAYDENLCGYWAYGVNDVLVNTFGHWSSNDNSTPLAENFYLCNFWHMTHFTLLVDAPRDPILNIITIVGCILSVVGVTAIQVTGAIFQSWRSTVSVKLLLNFSFAILLQMILLFLSNFVQAYENRWQCIVVAVGLHYIIISQFSWMLVISYLQYRKFVHVLINEPKHILMKSLVLGWLAPIIPVTIVATIDINNYTNDELCYLSGMSLYLAQFLPIGLVIIVNAVMFTRILMSLLLTKTKAFGEKQNLIFLKIKWGLVLFFLMGFSWVFGLLAGFLNSLILSYLFCITTTIQGFVMFVYFGVLNRSVRKLWLNKLNNAKNMFDKFKESSKSQNSTSKNSEY